MVFGKPLDLTVGITDELAMKFQERREELQTERKKLPAAIASLSAEGHKLVETLGTANGTAHRLLEERIEELGAQITHRETRLYQIERALNELARPRWRRAGSPMRWLTSTMSGTCSPSRIRPAWWAR